MESTDTSHDFKPIPTTLNQIPPAPVTRNASEFYAVFELSQLAANYIGAVSFVQNAWKGFYLTGPTGVTSAPAPMVNCNLKTIAVGSDMYAVYMTSAMGLSVIKYGDSGWSSAIPALAFTAINNFTLFTDGANLYVLVNDNNTLKYAKLDGTSWTQTVLTGNNGKTSAAGPVTGSQLSAAFNNGVIHCAYQAPSTIGSGFQALSIYGAPSAPAWSQAGMIHTSSLPKGVKLFVYNGFLFVAFTHNDGDIDVLYFNATLATPAWQVAYESDVYGTVAASLAPDVAVVNGGIFIVFPDSAGNLQTTFFISGLWNTVQLSGANSQILPSAPAAVTSPAMTVYADTSLHICYNAAGNVLQDVFYVFPSWYQQQLFPNLPSA